MIVPLKTMLEVPPFASVNAIPDPVLLCAVIEPNVRFEAMPMILNPALDVLAFPSNVPVLLLRVRSPKVKLETETILIPDKPFELALIVPKVPLELLSKYMPFPVLPEIVRFPPLIKLEE